MLATNRAKFFHYTARNEKTRPIPAALPSPKDLRRKKVQENHRPTDFVELLGKLG
jgi:hypothetical protein